MDLLFKILKHTSSLSAAIPLICCFIRFKTFNKELKVLFVYIIVSVFTEIVSFIFTQNNIRTYLISLLFTLTEGSILMYIYFKRYDFKQSRVIISVLYFVFLLLTFYLLYMNIKFHTQSSILSTYEAALLIGLSGGYILKVMKEINTSRLKEVHFTWINVGVLLYFSMAILLFLFFSYIEKRGIKTYNNLYSLHWITNIGYNILLAIGIWKIKTK